MDKAYSFIKHKLITAGSSEYRQNLDDQIVCPTCYEQVFKKKLWVVSKQSHTHFFSHYYGDPDSCSERTSGEGYYEDSKDKTAQLQRLEIYNQIFRENILISFSKIVGKKVFNQLNSAIEFAERLCIKDIDIPILEKIEIKIISNLDQPITTSINQSLEDLRRALYPIYSHLKNYHGKKNLKFITCVTLLIIFHQKYKNLEDILHKSVITSHKDLDRQILGNVVLLLINSVYVDWKGSIKLINNFLDPPVEKKQPKKKTLIKNSEEKRNTREKRATSGYFPCTHCKEVHYSEPNIYKHCTSCNKYFFTSPEKKLKSHKEFPPMKSVDSEHTGATKLIQNIDERWFYCIKCNHHYFARKLSLCPHNIKSEKLNKVTVLDIKQSVVSQHVIKCSSCKANFLGVGNDCPYCSKNLQITLKKCRSCGNGLIKSALLPSKTGLTWRKCNFCNLNFEYKNF